MENTKFLDKRKWIGDLARGKSYVDIGGLWGTTGETITTADAGGARSVTLADVQPRGHRLWNDMEAHCKAQGLTRYRKIQADVLTRAGVKSIGMHDIVHCSGIMYHVPDIFQFVGNLASLARTHLIIGSVVMPEVIENEFGRLDFPPDVAMLTPLLTDKSKAIVAKYLEDEGRTASGITKQGRDFIDKDGKAATGPWWWLFSGEFMARAMALYGMKILAAGPQRGGISYTVIAERS